MCGYVVNVTHLARTLCNLQLLSSLLGSTVKQLRIFQLKFDSLFIFWKLNMLCCISCENKTPPYTKCYLVLILLTHIKICSRDLLVFISNGNSCLQFFTSSPLPCDIGDLPIMNKDDLLSRATLSKTCVIYIFLLFYLT